VTETVTYSCSRPIQVNGIATAMTDPAELQRAVEVSRNSLDG
jgi:hypothetical protein